ncbi:PREDICTED: serine protease gd-like isoform X2 [Papilio xuthus]|uniref:Serine protease gd-like isoform X2 n=1 Tax=Papilio xuthus TaxID=66420 RepID=A0AAJ6Z9F2_PAPXU|nr:PREDICTED: serine protease gd-like isoform X2 [Papilio xuthus]
MNCVSINVFVTVGISLLLFANAQSPCPDIFEYKNDDNGVYGLLTLKPNGRKSTITVRTNFTITAKLASEYVGNIRPYGGANAITEYNKGQTIQYRVNLPVSSPLPKITAIYINEDLVCSDNPDTLETSNYVTTISLQHTLYASSGTKIIYGNTRPSTYTPIKYNIQNDRVVYNIPSPFDGTTGTYPVQPKPETPVRRKPPPPRPPVQNPVRDSGTSSRVSDGENSSNIQCGQGKIGVPLIWHGQTYPRGEWPWLVALYQTVARTLTFVCSGTLISDRHVLTAAHCMTNKQATDMIVKIGVYNLDEWGGDVEMRKLQAADVHENYDKVKFSNDISLLTLEKSVEFNSNIKPACLWGTDDNLDRIAGHTGVVTGWGDNESGKGGHGDPRMIRLPIVTNRECRATRSEFHKLTSDTTLCAGNRDGSGPCAGDSGGGLFVLDDGRWRVRGIVSLAISAKSAEKPCNLDEYVIFTDVAKYRSWIKRHMAFS